MNTKKLLPILCSLGLALSGCIQAQPVPAQPNQAPLANPTLSQVFVAVTRTPRPTATQIPTITSTPAPTFTATSDPAIFDPKTFGDIRKVDSFVVTDIWKETGEGYLYDSETRFEYNHSPAGFHSTYKFHGFDSSSYSPDTTTSQDTYWLGEWSYGKDNQTGLWYVSRAAKENFTELPLDGINLASTITISYFKSAKYLGVEQYNGIPAYHYIMDETNLVNLENWKVDKAIGELFVSVEGRYPLHSYARFSGKVIPAPAQDPPWAEGVVEKTQDLVSFNQPVQVSLPVDYPNFDLDLDFPLPPGSVLGGVNQDTSGGMHYDYVTLVNAEEYKAFYASFDPASGWSALGPSDVHYGDFWCTACLIFSKGGQKVALEFFDDMRFTTHIAYHIYVNFLPSG